MDPEDMPPAFDESGPGPVDDDEIPRYESLWLARARASAARSEPLDPPALPRPDGADVLDAAHGGGVEEPVTRDPLGEPGAYELEADESWPIVPGLDAVGDSPGEENALADRFDAWRAAVLAPRAPVTPFPSAPANDASWSPDASDPDVTDPGPSAVDVGAPGDAQGDPRHEVVASEIGPVPPAVTALVPAAVVAPPPAAARAGWPLGRVAGVAIATVGCGAVLVTMLVPRPDSGVRPAAAATPAAVRPAAAAAASRAVAAPIVPRWRETTEYTGGRRRSVAFELEAERPVRLWMRQATPVLVLRCLRGTLDAFVVTRSATAIEPGRTDHTVGLVFDEAPVAEERWMDSAEHDGLFSPDGAALLSRVSSSDRLRFRFTPHNAPPAEASFSLAGAQALVGPLRKSCRAF